MGKKAESTIENRVYLFRDLASAWLAENGGLLASEDGGARKRALKALADIAYVSCVVADTADEEADHVAASVEKGR